MKISIVIPALNEESGIEAVIRQVPVQKLKQQGYDTEIIVADNDSKDDTAEIARRAGATVIAVQERGYGNAYKSGLDHATGEIVVTGDADMTYPFDMTLEMVQYLIDNDIEFLNTNRLEILNPGITAWVHALGTKTLTMISRVLFRCPFRDSQSGMWIFRRYVWEQINVESSGMPFSQEIKIEAFLKGFRCGEIPIEYRPRVGESKLNTLGDGFGALRQLVMRKLAKKKKAIKDLKQSHF